MGYQIIDLEQRSCEWLDFRKKHIGASEAPIIMKESPWKTPRQLMMEKWDMGGRSFTSRAMQRGIDLEPKARAIYMDMVGIEVEPLVVKSLDHPFMIASYDGISADRSKLVEIKCPGEEDHYLAKAGEIPRKYYYQLLQQMIVVGANEVDYFSYRGNDDVALVTMHLDEKEMKRLIKEEERFWECWKNLEEPDLMAADFIQKDDPMWALAASEYIEAKKTLKEVEDLEQRARKHLIELSGGVSSEGAGLRIHKQMRKGLVDYSTVPELKGINLDKYRKPAVESWRFIEV